MSGVADVVDTVLEGPVVPSFTRLGHAIRSRTEHWGDLAELDATGRVIVLTGGTSGLGLAAATRFAAAGADLVLLGRNAEKTDRVAQELAPAHGIEPETVIADMGELDDVRRAATEILGRHDRIDALVHNAGALTDTRRETRAGLETTVASQVVGPFLLTTLLLHALDRARGRVVTMSSGGMYATGLHVSSLEMTADEYRGSEQYARAKRAQVTLNAMWPDRQGDRAITFHAVHPGWADTPGVEASLPRFRRLMGPLLRTPDQGADTMVWLTLDDGEPLAHNGEFWHDRRIRAIHKLPTTRRTDTPERRAALWERISDQAGVRG